LKDGSYAFYDETYQFSEEDATNAVGIVYDLNEEGKPRGILGLKNSWGQWAKQETTGYTTKFEDIICTPTTSSASDADFEGDTDGSDNWAYICEIDKEGSANPATNYPIFSYALNYAETTGLTDTDYDDGWYIPSIAELAYIYKNLTTINSVLTNIKTINSNAANLLNSYYYWSSSQTDSSLGFEAWYINTEGGGFTSSNKDWDSPGVCCIHLIEE
jgi:hypothetical protein